MFNVDSDIDHGQREQRHGPNENRGREDLKCGHIENQLDGT